MNDGPRLTISRSVALVAATLLVLGGASVGWLFSRPAHDAGGASRPDLHAGREGVPAAQPSAPPGAAGSLPQADVVVPLAQDVADRAGIVVTPVSTATTIPTLRIPGVVEPNAYRQVAVTPLAGGRVTRVHVQLGDRVRRGQTLAQVYSPELAEAQTRLIALRAEFDAAERQVNRTRRLVDIGAASRQELEQVHAEHAGHAAALAGARSRLVLLGMTPAAVDRLSDASEVSATIDVPSPLDGSVTERTANVGLNVDPSTKLFTIVDLATVWVVGDVYERDFSRVRVGSPATVTTAAYPDAALQGRVGYVDPQVNPQTRTTRARVEVANPNLHLRLGMLAQIDIRAAEPSPTITVPREALQTVGDRQVVYLADSAGRFVERPVETGARDGDQVEILGGLQDGDRVVTKGSFFVRAERDRLGLKPSATSPSKPASVSSPATPAVQTTRVVVSDRGFEPARVNLKAGVPARLEFIRTSDRTCATEVVFPALGIRKPLPLDQPVTIDIPAREAGEVAFACGMDMMKGVAVVSR